MNMELIYKELSYKLNGLAFEIDNKLGFGLSEKTYCNALEELLNKERKNRIQKRTIRTNQD